MNAETFLPSAQGKPILTKAHQALLHRYMRLRTPPWIVLCDVGPIPGLEDPEVKIPRADGFDDANAAILHPTPAEAAQIQHQPEQRQKRYSKTLKDHLSHVRDLQKSQPPRTILEHFGSDYQDYLQGPLQPLADNLESMTYEVFERDPVKYDLYEQAIQNALLDWVQQKKPVSGPNGHVVLAIVGAGRGPLVTRALSASRNTGIKIELWAVEKNPNAYVLLQRHNELSWHGQVHLVHSDMRSWQGPTSLPSTHQNTIYPHYSSSSSSSRPSATVTGKQPPHHHYAIDILVSELLGSFADNELSPECLDGITPLLQPTHGISIPQSYTSYLTPIAAPKLHADILARTPGDPTAPNTPYVVMLHAVDYLSTTTTSAPPGNAVGAGYEPIVLAAWEFRHRPDDPNIDKEDPNQTTDHAIRRRENNNNNKHNARSARLTFPIPHRAACHGLAGYFEAVLYAD
ncbi:MAG: hypothetical protein Q9219_004810, partial [cf. Caloplaca sp. 3 TL-2023]